MTIIIGSLWARAAWNTWWTWDPRLTAVFLLWAIYSGYLILRANLEDPQQSARFRAVLAVIVGAGYTDDSPGNALVSRHASGFTANGAFDAGDSGSQHRRFYFVICTIAFAAAQTTRFGQQNRIARTGRDPRYLENVNVTWEGAINVNRDFRLSR